MHRAPLWLHCFLAEAFKVLYSELRLESLVQLCSTVPPLLPYTAPTVWKPASADCPKFILVWTVFPFAVAVSYLPLTVLELPVLSILASASFFNISFRDHLFLNVSLDVIIASPLPTCLAQYFLSLFLCHSISEVTFGTFSSSWASCLASVHLCILTIARILLHSAFSACIMSLL